MRSFVFHPVATSPAWPDEHVLTYLSGRLLTFHPNSTFSDVADDPAEFALRSPFPTMLVLRGTDVREAEDLCDIQGRVTEDIAIANEARLRTVGYDKLRDIFSEIMQSAKTGESERELSRIQAARQAAISDLVASEEYEYDGLDGLESAPLVRDPVRVIARILRPVAFLHSTPREWLRESQLRPRPPARPPLQPVLKSELQNLGRWDGFRHRERLTRTRGGAPLLPST